MPKENGKLTIKDVSSCDFLDKNIKDERKAVEVYMKESKRTNDNILKTFYHSIAVDEMKHLSDLESIYDGMSCKKNKNNKSNKRSKK